MATGVLEEHAASFFRISEDVVSNPLGNIRNYLQINLVLYPTRLESLSTPLRDLKDSQH